MLVQQKAQEWLEGCVPIATLTDMQATEVRALVGTRALHLLIGLMLGSRQTSYVQLSNTRLTDPAAIALASVLQGRIQGIDLLRETLLELFAPAQADEGAREQP